MLIDKVAIVELPMLIVGRVARLVLGNARRLVVFRSRFGMHGCVVVARFSTYIRH